MQTNPAVEQFIVYE